MRCSLCLLLTCFVVLSPFSVSEARRLGVTDDVAASEAASQAVSAVNAFAIDVYRELAAGSDNIFFSPYSISSALAMTYAGARGDTAAEMAKALHFTENTPDIHAAMNSLQRRFNSIPEESGTFSVANRLWLDKSEKLIPDYEALVVENYGAGVEPVDFKGAAESARMEINDWVAEKTRDKIKHLLHQGDVTRDTNLILVNAVYFNSVWARPFDKKNTREEPFRTGKDEQHNVPMMRQKGHYLYGENQDAQWINVPYKIPGYSMLILLPRENESFTQMEDFERKLTVETLSLWISDMSGREVELIMPKFKDERRYPLTELLNKLGMNLAFTNDADFTGMVKDARKDGQVVKIDSVIHQAFIELDEERTEAAAATAVVMMKAMALPPQEHIVFRADHPFIYCLVDDLGTVLFMGRINTINNAQ